MTLNLLEASGTSWRALPHN
uniref:Uncharacterized protein n=1 Tax=Anguilla anguilla TaxID=7936 RepID=A0A0E9T338_ANGAN